VTWTSAMASGTPSRTASDGLPAAEADHYVSQGPVSFLGHPQPSAVATELGSHTSRELAPPVYIGQCARQMGRPACVVTDKVVKGTMIQHTNMLLPRPL
jgi:hypothetical protein